jgi:hypothetical protein
MRSLPASPEGQEFPNRGVKAGLFVRSSLPVDREAIGPVGGWLLKARLSGYRVGQFHLGLLKSVASSSLVSPKSF